MNDFDFSIPASALLAVAPFVSVEESRPLLHGVLIEPRGPRMSVVATNGHVLAAHHVHADENIVWGPDAPLVLRCQWHGFKKVLSADTPYLHFRRHPRETSEVWEVVGITKRGENITLRAIELSSDYGHYPNWRQVMPSGRDPTPLDAIGVALQYSERFAEWGRMKKGHCSVQFFGDDRAMILRPDDNPDLLGLWMPCLLDGGKPPAKLPPFALGAPATLYDKADGDTLSRDDIALPKSAKAKKAAQAVKNTVPSVKVTPVPVGAEMPAETWQDEAGPTVAPVRRKLTIADDE